MLAHLQIRNIALIERLNLELYEGLNILTGETGAGKSIIIDSINAILGGRVSKELIRTGEERALIEVIYTGDCLNHILNDIGIELSEDGSVIISREIFHSGRNICRVNGNLVTVSMLKKIGEKLVDVHGQHDNQSLLRTESHLELLDLFAGEKLFDLKKIYIKERVKYLELKNKLKVIIQDIGEREKRIDMLKYQIEEIKMANLEVNEEESLQKERLILSNSEKIIHILSLTQNFLTMGNGQNKPARDLIDECVTSMKTISGIDVKFEKLTSDIENISYLLDDVNESIREEKENIEFNPSLLEEIQIRIDLINSLKRKYGNTILDILDYLEKSSIELNELENVEENTVNMKNKLVIIEKELVNIAKQINAERVKTGKFLEDKIKKELADLEIKNSDFKVDIVYEKDETEINFKENGLDKVEFLISTNKGEPLKPLSKIASGGEMSRIMLAIKTILASVDKIETLIFDEIDTGISGIAAQKVGKKLSQISMNHQVICVTHLPQIASLAENHFYIEKITGKNTLTTIKRLNYNEKVIEIARLLAGDDSEITTNLAKEMIDKANNA